MTLPRTRSRAIALLFGPVLLAGLGTPARAIEPYPGETREAFVARSALEQQRKLAEADTAAGELAPGFASGGDAGSPLGDHFRFGMFGLVTLVLVALRVSGGILRASRALTKVGGVRAKTDSFEDRLAEKLRELERTNPVSQSRPEPQHVSVSAEPPPAPLPTPQFPAAPRTFGRRTG